MEPIKRKTLYLPPELGGLGILHPLLQSQALTLKYFMYTTDENKQTKWLLFARYWMSLRLAKYDNKWSFLKTNNTPKYNGTDPPLNLQKSETTFIHHKTQIIQTANKTVKKLYQILRTEYYKQHTITSQNIWDRTFHTNYPEKNCGHTLTNPTHVVELMTHCFEFFTTPTLQEPKCTTQDSGVILTLTANTAQHVVELN